MFLVGPLTSRNFPHGFDRAAAAAEHHGRGSPFPLLPRRGAYVSLRNQPAWAADAVISADEERLRQLGYKQELRRKLSGFSNFAVSFSIISILAGCITSYGLAMANGGPVAITMG